MLDRRTVGSSVAPGATEVGELLFELVDGLDAATHSVEVDPAGRGGDVLATECKTNMTTDEDLEAAGRNGEAPSFSDVPNGFAHHEDIVWLAQSGISRVWDMPDGTVQF